jgi:hypothetical protein
MRPWSSAVTPIIDCHTHLYGIEQESRMLAIADAAGIAQMNLLAHHYAGDDPWLPPALYMKARHPGRFFVFAGLDHTAHLTHGRVPSPPLAEQVDRFIALGCDGIKMLEGKPTSRQRLPIAFDDPYFADYFARVEERGFPMLWHVNDPEEFWDPARIPNWAKERRWGYGPGDIQKEQLYAEVEWVLDRYPDLKIVFAHFYFLSADLPRAAEFLDEHPNVLIDLAPGVEMLYNISRDPDAGREFFTQYADRIVFGSDIQSSLTEEEGVFRAGITFRWLESAGEFRVPAAADFLLGPPEDGVIRGMALAPDVLRRLYRDNFVGLVGAEPRPLNVSAAIEECERYAAEGAALHGNSAAETRAGRVAALLAGE